MSSILKLECPLSEKKGPNGVITHVDFETGERITMVREGGRTVSRTNFGIEDIIHFEKLAKIFSPRAK